METKKNFSFIPQKGNVRSHVDSSEHGIQHHIIVLWSCYATCWGTRIHLVPSLSFPAPPFTAPWLMGQAVIWVRPTVGTQPYVKSRNASGTSSWVASTLSISGYPIFPTWHFCTGKSLPKGFPGTSAQERMCPAVQMLTASLGGDCLACLDIWI